MSEAREECQQSSWSGSDEGETEEDESEDVEPEDDPEDDAEDEDFELPEASLTQSDEDPDPGQQFGDLPYTALCDIQYAPPFEFRWPPLLARSRRRHVNQGADNELVVLLV
jgi:hypothetical protein